MHPSERRRELRGLYVYKRLPMEACCAAMKLPRTTGNRWKTAARADGDDWDKARAAAALSEDTFNGMARRLLEDYLIQHQATIDMLRDQSELPAPQRAQLLAMLSDSFHKTMASFKRLTPELSRHAVALDALQRLATFCQQRYPQHVPAILELLEPFGEELAKAYG